MNNQVNFQNLKKKLQENDVKMCKLKCQFYSTI